MSDQIPYKYYHDIENALMMNIHNYEPKLILDLYNIYSYKNYR